MWREEWWEGELSMKIKTDNTNTLLSEQRVIVRYFIMLNIFVKSLSSFTVANCLFFFISSVSNVSIWEHRGVWKQNRSQPSTTVAPWLSEVLYIFYNTSFIICTILRMFSKQSSYIMVGTYMDITKQLDRTNCWLAETEANICIAAALSVIIFHLHICFVCTSTHSVISPTLQQRYRFRFCYKTLLQGLLHSNKKFSKTCTHCTAVNKVYEMLWF